MRQVWILGDDSMAQSRLSLALTKKNLGVIYRVQNVASLDDVPEGHFAQSGVTFLLDAFGSSSPGFEGLKQLREKGFQGPVIVLGEPAPEEAVKPFMESALTAFVQPVDRFDVDFVSGMIHCFHYFNGKLDLKHFLADEGKASLEKIENMKDFNQLVSKLLQYASRLGIDAQKIKRALVGMSKSHVANSTEGPAVTSPFVVCYGMDENKFLLAVSISSVNLNRSQLKDDFAKTLSQLKNPNPNKNSRVDFLNIAKLTHNLFYFGGSAVEDLDETPYLLTSIAVAQQNQQAVEPYSFGFVEAAFSEELIENFDVSNSIPESEAFLLLKNEEELNESPNLEASQESEQSETSEEAASLSDKSNIHEPSLLGDKPDIAFPVASAAPKLVPKIEAEESAEDDSAATSELKNQLKQLEAEMLQSKKLAEALSTDVKRLMKERRQPLTNDDLKERLVELEIRFKKTQEQNKKQNDIIVQKDEQIELLKAQVDRLKTKAA